MSMQTRGPITLVSHANVLNCKDTLCKFPERTQTESQLTDSQDGLPNARGE